MKKKLRSHFFESLAALEKSANESIATLWSDPKNAFPVFKVRVKDVKTSLESLERQNKMSSENLMDVNASLMKVQEKLKEALRLFKTFEAGLEVNELPKVELQINHSKLLEAVQVKISQRSSFKCECCLNTEDSQLLFETPGPKGEATQSELLPVAPMKTEQSNKLTLQASKTSEGQSKYGVRLSGATEASRERNKSEQPLESRFEDLPSLRVSVLSSLRPKNDDTKKVLSKSSSRANVLASASNDDHKNLHFSLYEPRAAVASQEQPQSTLRLNERNPVTATLNIYKPSEPGTGGKISFKGSTLCVRNFRFSSDSLRKCLHDVISAKKLERINFHENIFECDPLQTIKSVFTTALPKFFTIDLRKNQFHMGCSRDLTLKLLSQKLKIIL